MDKSLRAELWEIQVILYWILGAILIHWGHNTLGSVAVIWGCFSLLGTLNLLHQARKEREEKEYHV